MIASMSSTRRSGIAWVSPSRASRSSVSPCRYLFVIRECPGELYPAGDAELAEDLVQVVLDEVLALIEHLRGPEAARGRARSPVARSSARARPAKAVMATSSNISKARRSWSRASAAAALAAQPAQYLVRPGQLRDEPAALQVIDGQPVLRLGMAGEVRLAIPISQVQPSGPARQRPGREGLTKAAVAVSRSPPWFPASAPLRTERRPVRSPAGEPPARGAARRRSCLGPARALPAHPALAEFLVACPARRTRAAAGRPAGGHLLPAPAGPGSTAPARRRGSGLPGNPSPQTAPAPPPAWSRRPRSGPLVSWTLSWMPSAVTSAAIAPTQLRHPPLLHLVPGRVVVWQGQLAHGHEMRQGVVGDRLGGQRRDGPAKQRGASLVAALARPAEAVPAAGRPLSPGSPPSSAPSGPPAGTRSSRPGLEELCRHERVRRVSRARRVSDGWSIRAASSSTDVASGICRTGAQAQALQPPGPRPSQLIRQARCRLAQQRSRRGASPAASRSSAAASIRRAR